MIVIVHYRSVYATRSEELLQFFVGKTLFVPLVGASINYVDKQGGEGVCQMSTILHKLMYLTCQRRGRKGAKSSNSCQRSLLK